MRLKPIQNIFFKIIPTEDGFSAGDAKALEYDIPDKIKKGYRYIPEGDRYIRNKNEFKIEPLGVVTLGVLAIALVEGVKLLVK